MCAQGGWPTMKYLLRLAILLSLLNVSITAQAQLRNLLQNPDADQGATSWRAFGAATVEATPGGNFCFVLRNGGYFIQDVELPDDAPGKYAVLIGNGSSERIESDGAITDLPYLYGYMMQAGPANGGRILEYLQGQQMLAQPNIAGAWVKMFGIFKVPENTKKIRFFLDQALRKGVPHNGSAARFDNVGLYVFETKEEAETFVTSR